METQLKIYIDRLSDEKTEKIRENLTPDFIDVDEEDLAAVGGCLGKPAKLTFWITEDAVYRLDQFHEHCGLDLTEERSRKMRNDDVIGQSFRGFVKQKPSKDGTRMYSNIERTLPAED